MPGRVDVVSLEPGAGEAALSKKRQKDLVRQGLLLRDEDVLQAMEPGDKPVFLPYEQNKKGELEGSLATKEQFALLERFVAGSLRDLAGQVFSGRGRAQPHCARAEGFKLHVLRLSERVPQGRVPGRGAVYEEGQGGGILADAREEEDRWLR